MKLKQRDTCEMFQWSRLKISESFRSKETIPHRPSSHKPFLSENRTQVVENTQRDGVKPQYTSTCDPIHPSRHIFIADRANRKSKRPPEDFIRTPMKTFLSSCTCVWCVCVGRILSSADGFNASPAWCRGQSSSPFHLILWLWLWLWLYRSVFKAHSVTWPLIIHHHSHGRKRSTRQALRASGEPYRHVMRLLSSGSSRVHEHHEGSMNDEDTVV